MNRLQTCVDVVALLVTGIMWVTLAVLCVANAAKKPSPETQTRTKE